MKAPDRIVSPFMARPRCRRTSIISNSRRALLAGLGCAFSMGAVSAQVVGGQPSLQKESAVANAVSGPRGVPAKRIPVPEIADPAMRAAIAAPYSRLWNLSAPNAAAWRMIVAQGDKAFAATVEQLRTATGVTVEPTIVGGVKGFMVRPRTVPPGHKGKLIVHLHGGGFVFGHGQAGTQEAVMIAALAGYEVLFVDYRISPEKPTRLEWATRSQCGPRW